MNALRTPMAALAGLAFLAACVGEDRAAPQPPTVTGEVGTESNVQRFDIRARGKRVIVRIFRRANNARVVTVQGNSFRGLDRSDGQLALEAAAAGRQIDCAGQPMLVVAESGQFQEQGCRSAVTGGEAAWIFQAQCG